VAIVSTEGPGTHLLVVGAGGGSAAAGKRILEPALHSAAALYRWFTTENNRNPGTSLASVDILMSRPGPTIPPAWFGGPGGIADLEPPTFAALERALAGWMERANSDIRNIAVFYFAGYGLYGGRKTALLLDQPDFPNAPPGHEIASFYNIVDAMTHCTARSQLYIVDRCLPPSLEGMEARSFSKRSPDLTSDPLRTILDSEAPGERAYSPGSGVPSFLMQSLLGALGAPTPTGGPWTARSLMSEVVERMVATTRPLGLKPHLERDDIGDFELYFLPKPPPPPPSQVKPQRKARKPKATPGKAVEEISTTAGPEAVVRDERSAAEAPESGLVMLDGGPAADAGADAAEPEERADADLQQVGEWEPRPGVEAENQLLAQAGHDPMATRVGWLTARQRECLGLFGLMGLSTQEIAARLGIAQVTVNRHLQAAVATLAVRSRSEAAKLLERYGGWVEPPAQTQGDKPKAASISASAAEPNTHFVTDDPEVERDDLRRGPLAIALGRRLHRIWCRSNGIKVPGDEDAVAGGDERSSFVLHLDAPWGGGKTSFANFLDRVLNPFPRGAKRAADFLHERAGQAVGTIFIDDPPGDGKEGGTAARWPEDSRRPWIVVPFNAWQAEHCSPPWWTFYQAIRKGCFAAVWAEGRGASRPAQSSAPPAPLIEERIWSWAALWRRELWWRLRNPKILARLATFALAAIALVVLWRFDLVFQGDKGPNFNAGNALGFVLAGIGGISGLWGLGALLTESVAPGTDDAAERRSLGGGDPFERFRRHFVRTMAAVRRPVMVVVDDLDRCRPDFVVDLVRGIQTLLRSPRVVFVILGDRDWIERAFEAHHAAMSKVNVGQEQEFGARFVEKAIQMSFILPEMPDASQDAYVRRVLIGPGAVAADAAPPPPPDIAQQLRAEYRETVATAESAEERQLAEQALRHKYESTIQAIGRGLEHASNQLFDYSASDYRVAPDAEAASAQADKLLSEERALSAAVDEKMGQALLHRLEPLARFFPPNPRQIKRIVNAITMYTAVAYLQMEMDESDERGIELAIWVIVMTEWPKTWRVLASCPRIADVLAEADPKAALDRIDESELPGSREATLKEVNRIRADPDLLALITAVDEGRPRLRTSSVEAFVRLTPLYSRKQRLEEAGDAKGTGRAEL